MTLKLQFLATLLFTSVGIAQTTVPNMSFEEWTNVGSSNEEPTNWNSNKTGSGLASVFPQTCFRDSNNPHTGSYSARMQSGSFFGTVIPGGITTGKINLPTSNPDDAYVQTLRNDADFNAPFTDRPENFGGYFRFTSVNNSNAGIRVYLHGDYDVTVPDNNNSASYIIGEAEFIVPANSVTDWTYFNVPFTYYSTDVPSYMLVVMATGLENGTTLWVDDFEVSGSTLGFESMEAATAIGLRLYPNPATDYLTIQGGDANTNYKILNVLGAEILNGRLSSDQKLNVSTLAKGLYIVNFDTGAALKFVKN